MKKILLIIGIIIVLTGAWFGYQELRRNQLLNSGVELLLVNKKAGYYIYSSDIDLDNIDRSWKIIGKVEKLSQQKQQQTISGLEAYRELKLKNPEDLALPILPENDEEQSDWQRYLSTLTEAQKGYCQEIQFQDTLVYCLIRHGVLNAIQNGVDSSICEDIYILENKEECIQDVSAKKIENVPDRNNDGLIDSFELYTERYRGDIEYSGIINPTTK